MAYSQNNNVTAIEVKYHSVFSNPKSISPQPWTGKLLSVFQRLLGISEQGFSDSLLEFVLQALDVLDGSVGLVEFVFHSPKTTRGGF